MRKTVGLAFSSGGARSLAFVGVLKVLEKNKIPIDYIAGVSGGAMMGSFYAKYKSSKALEKAVKKIGYREFIKTFLDPSLGGGVLKGERVIKFLEKYLGKTKIENTKIPFRAVATDVISGKPHIFKKGSLTRAIRASSSLPFLFKPYKFEDKLFIDGGISTVVPVEVVRQMGADIVIAVNLYSLPKISKAKAEKVGMIGIMRNSVNLVTYYLAKEMCKKADIVISPHVPITSFTMIDFVKSNNFVKIGEEAAEKKISKIKKLLE
jgi:NTE family protein